MGTQVQPGRMDPKVVAATVGAIAKKFTPTDGYNLVGLDDFAVPGEGYYRKGNFPTFAEARDAAKGCEDSCYVVGTDGAWVGV